MGKIAISKTEQILARNMRLYAFILPYIFSNVVTFLGSCEEDP